MKKCAVKDCQGAGEVLYAKEEDGVFKPGLVCIVHAMEATAKMHVPPRKIDYDCEIGQDGEFAGTLVYRTHD